MYSSWCCHRYYYCITVIWPKQWITIYSQKRYLSEGFYSTHNNFLEVKDPEMLVAVWLNYVKDVKHLFWLSLYAALVPEVFPNRLNNPWTKTLIFPEGIQSLTKQTWLLKTTLKKVCHFWSYSKIFFQKWIYHGAMKQWLNLVTHDVSLISAGPFT